MAVVVNYRAVRRSFRMLGSAIGSALVGFIQSGTSAVQRTAQDKMRESVSVFDFMSDAMKADVLAGTATVDTLSAFQAAIDSFPTTFDDTFYSKGGRVYVPPGVYYLSDTLKISRNIILDGAGAPGGNDTGATELRFADNKDGIICEDFRASASGKQGSHLVLRGLYLSRKSAGGSVGSGISLKTTARVIQCMVNGFREHGIKIDASTSYTPASNANTFYIESCALVNNGLDGLYVEGADANAGTVIAVDARANGRWGIYDSSFLGNTYIGCHADSNISGPYKSDDPSACNVFLGCYSESGQPASSVSYPSIVIGGLHGAGVTATTPYMSCGAFGWVLQGTWNTDTARIGFGQSATSGIGLRFNDTSSAFEWTLEKTVGRWNYRWAGADAGEAMQFYDRTATPGNGYARDMSAANGGLGLTSYYIGGRSVMKKREVGAAAPVSGTYLQGDIVWNTAPTAGGTVGWVCTTGGTPGTWKTFGAISA